MFRSILLLLVLAPAVASAGNYAACTLDKLEKVQNDHAARAALSLCRKDYPGGLASVRQGSGRGFFSYDSGDECTHKRGAKTDNRIAAYQIRLACNRLYNRPAPPRSSSTGLFDDLIPAPAR